MKIFIISTILVCCNWQAFSQNDTTISQTKDSVFWKGFVLSGDRIGYVHSLASNYNVSEKFSFIDSNTIKSVRENTEHNYFSVNTFSKTDSNTLILNGSSESYVSKNNIDCLIQKNYYFNGKLSGPALYFDANGRLTKIESYSDNTLHGLWVTYYSNSQIKEAGHFSKGSRVGHWKEYYENGALKSEGAYYNNVVSIFPKSSYIFITLKDTVFKIPEDDDFYRKTEQYYDAHIRDSDPTMGYIRSAVTYPIILFPKDKIWRYFDKHGKVISKKKYNAHRRIQALMNEPKRGLFEMFDLVK